MKPVTLILAFLPLIVFSVLARFLPRRDIGIAGLAAAAVALIAILISRPIWLLTAGPSGGAPKVRP